MIRPTPFHLLVFAVSFSMVGICTALALQSGANPLTVVTIRTLGTATLMFGFFFLSKVVLSMGRRDRLIAIALGIPLSINNFLINSAIAEIPVPLVVLIFYLWPALTGATSWLLRKEPFRWRGLAGLLLAFSGVALALDVHFESGQAKGVWFAVGAAVNWTIVFMLTSHFFQGRDTRAPTLTMILTAAVIFVAACLITGNVQQPMTTLGWSAALGTAAFYAFGMIGIFAATVRIGPSRTGFYMNFEPIAAVLLAALILGQTHAPIQLVGAALVISALFLFRPPATAPIE